MTISQLGIMISIIVYLGGMLYVGYLCAKKNRSTDDFYLGGRKLGPVVTAMSAEASDMSSWLLMGLPGVAYFCGLADAAWTAIGLAIGTYVNWLLVARRLRRYSAVNHSITIPDFFANRFHDKGKALLGFAALIIIVFFIPYTASGFAACGKLFGSLFGVDYIWAMIISAVVIVGYTALGGFLAASTTDLIQSIVMTIALVIVLVFGINVAGGMEAVIENAKGVAGYLSLVQTGNVVTGEAAPYGTITIISMIAWGLGYFGMPHVLLRFMAIEDDKKLKISRRIATVWVVISMGVAVLIGIVGYAMTNAGAIELFQTSSEAETLIVRIADLISQHSFLAALVAGIILSGILASTMSTADSQLLAAASSVSENVFKSVFGLKLDEKKTMLVARLTVIAIALVAIFIARDSTSSVFGIVSFAWAGFGASFGPVMLFSLFWRRTNRQGALAGMICGGAMVFIWKYLIRPLGGAWDIYELLPAFLVASVAIVVVSILTPAPSEEVTRDFDRVKTMK